MPNHRIIIFGGDNYNTLGMIRTLGKKNKFHRNHNTKSVCNCFKSKYLKYNTFEFVDTIEQGYEQLIKMAGEIKAYILVEGDALTGYLDRRYDELSPYFSWNNAGEQGRLSKYLNKNAQIDLVRQFGINVLPSMVVNKNNIPNDIDYPVMTKAISSEINDWKMETHICNNKNELIEALGIIKSEEVLIQKYIVKKNELCLDGFSVDHGRKQFISIATTYNYLLKEGYSYHATISNPKDRNIEKQITEVMTEVGYEGIYSFEFIIDENDVPYFLEINFRNSGWSWASTCVDMPLPILWISSMDTGEVDKVNYKVIPDGYTFVDDFDDFRVRAGKSISVFRWLREYKNTDCKLIFGRNDIMPFVTYLFSRVISKVKRKLRAFVNS